jgi:DNA polymerase III subunit delta'
MTFDQVIGQQAVKEQLMHMLEHNRLSHALLFLGKEGSGALPLALAFSSYVIASNQKAKPPAAVGLFGEPEPVAEANQSEVLAQKYIHPDVHYTYPVVPRKPGDKPLSTDYITEWREFISQYPYGNAFDWLQFIGAENKQGNITAHECNDIIRKLNLKSFESGYKILIVWLPEYLGNEGNKLLKMIEEPPPNTLFLLVAQDESLILPTILSRVQLVKVPPLSNDEVSAALQARSGTGAAQAQQVAALSEGNYHEALQLLAHAESDWLAIVREWLNAVLRTGPVAQVKWIDDMAKIGREKQKQFLRYFTHLLEQSIRLRAFGNAASQLTLPENEHDFAQRLNKMCSMSQQQAIITELDKASYYIERNANAKMLFHALSIKLYHIIKDNSLILAN